MPSPFQIRSLDPQHIPALNQASADHHWLVADQYPGFPCRVSLQDARPGERVLVLSYAHHEVDSPYQASGPVFIRAGAVMAHPAVNEVPVFLRHRLLSLRAYDAQAMMLDAVTVPGKDLEPQINRLFADSAIRYLHIHNAGPGCFMCAVQRLEWS